MNLMQYYSKYNTYAYTNYIQSFILNIIEKCLTTEQQ